MISMSTDSSFNGFKLVVSIITARIRRMTGGYIFTLCVNPHLGGVPDPALEGGYLIQPWMGGQGRGEGGYLIKPWMGGGGGVPVSVKGKIFDTRFGLIHVQTGKKIFCQGTPRPPPSKGKIF